MINPKTLAMINEEGLLGIESNLSYQIEGMDVPVTEIEQIRWDTLNEEYQQVVTALDRLRGVVEPEPGMYLFDVGTSSEHVSRVVRLDEQGIYVQAWPERDFPTDPSVIYYYLRPRNWPVDATRIETARPRELVAGRGRASLMLLDDCPF